MNEQLYIVAEVLLNYNPEPCIHYNELFMPLYLTCKTMYNKFISEKRNVFNCDICHFRKIICHKCNKNNTKSCQNCKCKNCNISINLTGGFIDLRGICDRCPKPQFVGFHSLAYVSLIECLDYMFPLQLGRNNHTLARRFDPIDFDGDEFNYLQYDVENIFQHRTEEIVIKNIKTPNFKSTKYFEYKKTKNIKNNYKHNGQQFRRQNQLKQPR